MTGSAVKNECEAVVQHPPRNWFECTYGISVRTVIAEGLILLAFVLTSTALMR